jgi:mono/diheme cytochrome c family protein
MPTSLKRIGIIAASFILFIIIATVYTQVGAEVRLRKTYDIEVESIPIPSDETSLEKGKDLVVSGRCTDCHGFDLGGQISSDNPAVGKIYASNLTAGRGGVGRVYQDLDWIRAIRHGVGQDGRSLVITPAQFYYYLSDEDLGAIIAYIKSLPPVDNELPSPKVGPLSRMFVSLFGNGAKEWLPAEKIDHSAPRPAAPKPGITAEYGEYLVTTRTCLVCHSTKDISTAPGGSLAEMDKEEFRSAMRLSQDLSMSISVRRMTNDELDAMWLYLKTLEPEQERRSNQRSGR